MAIRRADGRTPRELRPVSITWEKLARADGSARFAFGPTDVPPAREHPARAYLDVQARPISGVPGPSSRALANTIKGCLSASLELGRYPRTMVQVVVQSLSSDSVTIGSAREDDDVEEGEGVEAGKKRKRWSGEYAPAHAASLNAASCASLNAGSVSSTGTLCAISLSRTQSCALYVDPTPEEWTDAEARGWFVFLVTRDEVEDESSGSDEDEDGLRCRAVWQSWTVAGGGEVENGEVEEARDVAEEGAKAVWHAMRRAVAETYGEILAIPVNNEGKDVRMGSSGESTGSEGSESEDDEEKMEI
ncbi:unnamed protein product [Peniophora sp. CBMAI 1063]|nr:unnamed protein product [Peniophora sp. CBMAI 1063]